MRASTAARRPLYADDVTIRSRGAVATGVNAVSTTLDARLGPRPSFADIATDQLDAVYRYLVFLTGDRSAAEDLAAETFEKAFRTWRRFDPRRGSPRTWLCQIARTTALDWVRAEARRKRREETYSRDLDDAADLIDGLPGPPQQ